MDDHNGIAPDGNGRTPIDPTEGVRIIGAKEAAEAMERGDIASRRGGAIPRFGDRPPPPPVGPRPTLRFPLDANADPTRIERPPVLPAPSSAAGQVALPHWTEAPTGEVPAVLIGEDTSMPAEAGEQLDAWSSFASSPPRWRNGGDDWDDDAEFITDLAHDDASRIGALEDPDARPTDDEFFSFDDLDDEVERRIAATGSTGDPPAVAPTVSPSLWADAFGGRAASAQPPSAAEVPAPGRALVRDDAGWIDSGRVYDDWSSDTWGSASSDEPVDGGSGPTAGLDESLSQGAADDDRVDDPVGSTVEGDSSVAGTIPLDRPMDLDLDLDVMAAEMSFQDERVLAGVAAGPADAGAGATSSQLGAERGATSSGGAAPTDPHDAPRDPEIFAEERSAVAAERPTSGGTDSSHERIFGRDAVPLETGGSSRLQQAEEAPAGASGAADEADEVLVLDDDHTGTTGAADATYDGGGEDHGDDDGASYDDGQDEQFDDEPRPPGGATRLTSGRLTRRSGSGDDGATTGGGQGLDRTRWIVGLAIAAIAALLFVLGPQFAMILVVAIAGFSSLEYFNALRRSKFDTATLLGFVACVAFPLAVYWRGTAAYPMLGGLAVMFSLLWYLAGAGGTEPRVVEGAGSTLLGIAWIGLLGSFAAAMLRADDGVSVLLTAVLATVAYDGVGYVVGSRFGRRPMSGPSPGKTVEGLVGGIAACLVVTLVAVGIFKLGPYDGFVAALLIGLAAAIAAPLGDLCESLVKRDLGVKDMGSVLPGHGGILDRFDALLFVLPAVYYVVSAIGHKI